MGRTSPTTRDRFDALEREWNPFRRSLRRRHQPTFDRLFEHARGHAEAATRQNPADPWQGFVFAILLAQEHAIVEQEETISEQQEAVAEQQRTIAEQRSAIDALREQVDAIEVDGAVEGDATTARSADRPDDIADEV